MKLSNVIGSTVNCDKKKGYASCYDLRVNISKRMIEMYILRDKGVFRHFYEAEICCMKRGSYIEKEKLIKVKKKQVMKQKTKLLGNFLYIDVFDLQENFLGKIVDVIFEETSGKLLAIICSKGFFEDFFCGRPIYLIDENLIRKPDRFIVEKVPFIIVNKPSLKNLFV